MSTEDWENKFFNDKSMFKFIDSDGHIYIRRKNESYDRRYVTTTVKYGGGSLMFWRGFSFYGTDILVEIKGTLNQNKHMELLNEHLLPYAKENLSKMDIPAGQHILPQNKRSQTLFSKKFCDCDARSPDLNPLENLWSIIKAQIKKNLKN